MLTGSPGRQWVWSRKGCGHQWVVGDSPCQGWIRPGNPSWPSESGAVVLGEMRGKDDEYDYLFKGGSAARPALAVPAMSCARSQPAAVRAGSTQHPRHGTGSWDLYWDITFSSQFSGRGRGGGLLWCSTVLGRRVDTGGAGVETLPWSEGLLELV